MRDAFDEYTTNPPSDFDHATSTTEGFQGVFEQLVSEHRQVAHLIARLFQEQGAQRAELWATLRRNVLAHEFAEHQVLYAALDCYPSLQVLIESHTHDVSVQDTQLRQLDALAVDTEEWELGLRRLEALLEAHVEKEEVELFPRAQDLLGPERVQELELDYLVVKSSLHEGRPLEHQVALAATSTDTLR
jgi:hypothetical protein